MRTTGLLVGASLLTVACLGEACSKDKGSGSKTLTADLTGAVGLAITKPVTEAGFAAFGGASQTTAATFSLLVKIDASGAVSPVLDQSRPAFHVSVTATHAIVSGDFHDVLDISGDALDCYLVAIPLTAAGEAVKCLLSEDPLDASFAGSEQSASLAKYSDQPGFVTLGETVYFAQILGLPMGAGGSNAASEFRRWVGGSDETELLIHLEAGGGGQLYQPYAIAGAPNVCVLLSNPTGQMFCGAVSPGTNWQDIGVDIGGGGIRPSAFLIGRNVVVQSTITGVSTVSLDDLTVAVSGSSGSTPFSLPPNRDLTATTLDGRIVGITSIGTSGEGPVVVVDSTGHVVLVEGTMDWSRMIADGRFGFFYGGGQLRRLDLATVVLGTSNLLGSTGMLQVTDMSFSSANRLRLDGTAANGSPVVVAVDTSSGAISISDGSLPRFQAVTNLQ